MSTVSLSTRPNPTMRSKLRPISNETGHTTNVARWYLLRRRKWLMHNDLRRVGFALGALLKWGCTGTICTFSGMGFRASNFDHRMSSF